MPNTDGFMTQDTPNNDLEIFVGMSEFRNTSASPTDALASSGPGDFKATAGSFGGNQYQANVSMALKRTGFTPTAAQAQQQFGTAALGPSDPEGIVGYPPYTAAQLPTIRGSMAGSPIVTTPVPKGIRINSIDAMYFASGGGPFFARFGLYIMNFTDNAAAVRTTLIDGTQDNLNEAQRVSGMIYKSNVVNPNPSFIITSGAQVIVAFLLTTNSGSTSVYGCTLKCSYNFN